MERVTGLVISACLCLIATIAYADNVSLSAHNVDWVLHMPASGFALDYKVLAEDGRKMQFMSANQKGMGLSGSLEPGPGSGTAKDCREYYWQNLKRSPFKFEQVKMIEVGEMATLEYLVNEVEGVPLNQKNIYAYFVKDDYWLYFHISKTLFRSEDASLFESMLSKVAFIQKSPSRKWDACYRISQESTVTLTVPQAWIDDFTQEKDQIHRTITFNQGNAQGSKVMLSPIPVQKGTGPDLTDPEVLKKSLERGANSLLPNAVEKEVIFKGLKGRAGSGFYYTLTDKTPQLPPGEYRYMTQGGMNVADLFIMFTIFTNDKASPVIAQSLEMLSSARQ